MVDYSISWIVITKATVVSSHIDVKGTSSVGCVLKSMYNGRSSRIYINVGTDNINNNNKDTTIVREDVFKKITRLYGD